MEVCIEVIHEEGNRAPVTKATRQVRQTDRASVRSSDGSLGAEA